MALKGDRLVTTEEIRFFSSGLIEKGQLVVLGTGTSGSGNFLDQAEAYVHVAAASGRVIIGMSTTDVVNLDLTRQHINYYKDEVQTGSKVTIAQKGWLVTNKVTGTPAAGNVAYADTGTAGNVTASYVATGTTPVVGRFLSSKDEDGYATVYLNLP